MRRQWYLIHCSYEFDTCPFLAFDNPTTAPIHCSYEVDACLLVGFWKSFNNFLLSTPHLRLIGAHRCSMKSLLQISFFQNRVKMIAIKWNERDNFYIFTWKSLFLCFFWNWINLLIEKELPFTHFCFLRRSPDAWEGDIWFWSYLVYLRWRDAMFGGNPSPASA